MLKYLFLSQLLLAAGCASSGSYVSNYVDQNLVEKDIETRLIEKYLANGVKRSLPLNPTVLPLL
ncbi:hypothetical protein [Bartonella gabonensis]|uniref:hypothetical protein n=1 Tax=Bartonella gabonensis TaxID=2699889 RepID=UPI001FE9E070|nr:hypothetical protein [Bartonella gabonensis]